MRHGLWKLKYKYKKKPIVTEVGQTGYFMISGGSRAHKGLQTEEISPLVAVSYHIYLTRDTRLYPRVNLNVTILFWILSTTPQVLFQEHFTNFHQIHDGICSDSFPKSIF